MLSLTEPTGGATVDTVRGESVLNILDDDGSMTPCEPGDDRLRLCLAGGRFKVQITWRIRRWTFTGRWWSFTSRW
jgi:hypothetical protein